eukprot:2548315-Amphidinium_carterae.1
MGVLLDQEPYHDPDQVTAELVDVLLDPLLIEGSAEVVFDTLSYSAGPLPEQLLADANLRCPVRVCWGEEAGAPKHSTSQSVMSSSREENVLPISSLVSSCLQIITAQRSQDPWTPGPR